MRRSGLLAGIRPKDVRGTPSADMLFACPTGHTTGGRERFSGERTSLDAPRTSQADRRIVLPAGAEFL